jgi:hypothetical protein
MARAQEAAGEAAQGFHFARPLPLADVPGSWHGMPCATRTRPGRRPPAAITEPPDGIAWSPTEGGDIGLG